MSEWLANGHNLLVGLSAVITAVMPFMLSWLAKRQARMHDTNLKKINGLEASTGDTQSELVRLRAEVERLDRVLTDIRAAATEADKRPP